VPTGARVKGVCDTAFRGSCASTRRDGLDDRLGF
jgi:hypothetical protein